MINSILGVSVKSLGQGESESRETCLPPETNQALNVINNPDKPVSKRDQLLESDAEVNIDSSCDRHQRNSNKEACDGSKPDSNFNEDAKSTGVSINEQVASSELRNEFKAVQQSNAEISSTRTEDVINGRYGEGGDTLLHVASRLSRTEILLSLLESGGDPAVK